MSGPELTLGYWKIRGLAEPIRMLLTHLGIPFEDVQYELMGSAPNYDPSQWTSVKLNLNLDFPNLPYLIDGNLRITESRGILKYICQKFKPDYLGQNLELQVKAEQLGCIIHSNIVKVAMACYNPNFANVIKGVLLDITPEMSQIGRVLDRQNFLVSNEPTYVDFSLFELLQLLKQIDFGFLASLSGSFLAFEGKMRSLDHVLAFENRHSPRLIFNQKLAIFNVAVP